MHYNKVFVTVYLVFVTVYFILLKHVTACILSLNGTGLPGLNAKEF